MRFTTAWGGVLSQNITLRLVIFALCISLGLVSILAVKMGFEEPIVIERACYSKAVLKGPSKHTSEEIEAFIKIAVSQRFDSNVEPSPDYLAMEEIAFKKQEQRDLASKSMLQKVVVNSITVNGSEIQVDADRIIGVGQVRTALVFPIVATIAAKTRTESNPYGLQLTRMAQALRKEESQ